jgi:hypothetical protein
VAINTILSVGLPYIFSIPHIFLKMIPCTQLVSHR